MNSTMTNPANPPTRSGLGGVLESQKPHRQPFTEYRGFIRDHYDGLPGR